MKLAIGTLNRALFIASKDEYHVLTPILRTCIESDECLIILPKNYTLKHPLLINKLHYIKDIHIISYYDHVSTLISINESLLTDDTLYIFRHTSSNTLNAAMPTFITKDISESAVFDILFRSSDSIFQ